MTTTDTEPTRWRKKPVEIDAMQWNGTAAGATPIIDWVLAGDGGISYWDIDEIVSEHGVTLNSPALRVQTLEGPLYALPGAWIIRGVRGEFYPCKPDIFEQTYELAEPHPVARVELFTDTTGDHRWRAIARNGEIVATCGEGYRNAAHARAMAERILPGVDIREAD